MRRILEKLKQNKKIVVIILAVMVVITVWWIATILANMSKGIDDEKFLVEIPLNNDVSHSPAINKNIYNSTDFPDKLGIYKFLKNDNGDVVNSFLVNVGKSSMLKSVSEEGYTRWEKGEEVVEYTDNYAKLSFYFEDGVAMPLSINITDTDSGEKLLESFYKLYFNKEYTFTDVRIVQDGLNRNIEGARNVSGLPLYGLGYDTRSDRITIDGRGKLKSGSLTLVEFESTPAQEISLVHITNLQEVMRKSDYPKVVYEGFSEDLIKYATDSYQEEENELPEGADNLIYKTLTPQSTAKFVKLVYYFSDTSLQYLVPSYQIYSDGRVIYDGKSFDMPLVIYTNALDPDRVYISNE